MKFLICVTKKLQNQLMEMNDTNMLIMEDIQLILYLVLDKINLLLITY